MCAGGLLRFRKLGDDRFASSRTDARERGRIERCPTDQPAINIWAGKEFSRIGDLDRAAIDNPNGFGEFHIIHRADHFSHHSVGALDVIAGGCLTRPDRPNGLVGN